MELVDQAAMSPAAVVSLLLVALEKYLTTATVTVKEGVAAVGSGITVAIRAALTARLASV